MTNPIAPVPTPVDRDRRYFSLFEHNWDAVYSLDRLGNFTEANPASERLTGYTRDELVAMNFAQLVAPEEYQRMRKEFVEGLAGDTKPAETVIIRKDGARRNVMVSTVPIKFGEEVAGLFGTARDITEQRQIEGALRDSEERYRALYAVGPDPLVLVDLETHQIVDANDAMLRLVGYPREELLQLNAMALSAEPGQTAEFFRTIQVGQVRTTSVRQVRRKDGAIVPVEYTARAFQLLGRNLLYVCCRDITKRQQAEVSLREAHASLEATLAALPDLLFEVDRAGRIYEFRAPRPELLYVEPRQFLGKRMQEVLPAEAAAIIEPALAEAAQTGRARGITYPLPMAGETRWFELSIAAKGDHRDPQTRFVFLARNVTERQQAETALRESEQRLDFALQASGAVPWGWNAAANRLDDWSPAYRALYGFAADAPSNYDTWIARIHPEDRSRIEARINHILETPGDDLYHEEFRIVHPERGVCWLEGLGRCYRDQAGRAQRMAGVNLDITARKQAEAALQASEERLRLVLQGADLGLYDWDLTTGQEVFNDRLVEMLGYSLAEVRQEISWWYDKIFPGDHPRIQEAYRAHMAGETPFYENEHRLRAKTGEWIWVLDRGAVVAWDATGRPTRFTGTHLDITARKQAEAALRESEERYRLMVDAMPVLAWRCDAAGLCLDCNVRWHEYTGQSPAEVRGTGWMAALHPDDRDRTLQKVKDDVAGGMIYQTEYRLRRAMDNTYRWHLVRALPVKDATGQIMAWFGCAADIEDAKQVEQILLRSHQELDELVRGRTLELETANRTLRESELRFRSLTEEIPAVTYIAGTGQTAGSQYVSPQIQEMLGISAAEFVADPDLWFNVIHPEDRPHVWAAVERLRQHGELLDLEYRVAHRNGKTVWVRDRAALMRDAVKRPLVQQGVLMDITRRKELELQVLAISEREQRRIAQDLHDGLCQHLSGLAFMAGALERQLTGSKGAAAKQAHRLATLLDDAVTQARRTARGLCPVNMEAGGLREALRELAGHVQEMFGTRCRLLSPWPVAVHDQTVALHLYRIAQEAVNNAMRHGKPSQITIGLTQRAGQVRLTVRDNGRGLPKRRRATTGMGLAVMEHRARSIGATFAVANARPRGTLVTCRLPQHQKEGGRS